jgi:hypothetical protein
MFYTEDYSEQKAQISFLSAIWRNPPQSTATHGSGFSTEPRRKRERGKESITSQREVIYLREDDPAFAKAGATRRRCPDRQHRDVRSARRVQHF